MKLTLFLLLEKFLMALPKKWRKVFFSGLATLGYHLSKRYRNVAFQNLKFAFDGKMSQKEMEEITKYSFKNLMFNFMHLMEMRYMSKEELESKITIENIEVVQKVHNEGRAVIYTTSHYCSWELGAAALGAFIKPIVSVYKPLKNPTFEGWLVESRGSFGTMSLSKRRFIKPIIKYIKDQTDCGILIDTNIKNTEGVEVDFLGKKVRQTTASAYLARKYNAALIPARMRTDDEEHYTLIFDEEIPVEKSDDEAADLQKAAQLQADWLSGVIRKEPKFWFWLHRRWKNSNPEIYSK